MGQQQCNCTKQSRDNTVIPKCTLLRHGLLSKFEMPDFANCHNIQNFDSSMPQKANQLPSNYIELFMALYSQNQKYKDIYFSTENLITLQGCERLSELLTINNNENNFNQTKFCLVFDFLNTNYPHFCEQIKPIYLESVGFAICTFYIQGLAVEVIVDDYIPEASYNPGIDSWIYIFQKGFAKVLGSYLYIEELSVGEIFSEVTGIPYYCIDQLSKSMKMMDDDKSGWNKQQKKTFNSFKDALKCDELLYKTKRFQNDASIFGYRKDFTISSIPFGIKKGRPHLIKFQIPYQQKISLRISQQNSKLKDKKSLNTLEPQYSDILFQLCQLKGESNKSIVCSKVLGHQSRFNNSIYINNVFTELPAGRYIGYVLAMQKDERLSIVSYAPSKLKFSEFFNEKVCNRFLQLFPHNYFTKKQLDFKTINQVAISINPFGNLVYLKIDQNHPGKKIALQKKTTYFINFPLEKQIPLDTINKKWIIIADCSNQTFPAERGDQQIFRVI